MFLDIDGTLIDIAATPDAIEIPVELAPLLARLDAATGGALALVSGRTLAEIDRYFPNGPRWIAGCHGGERRLPDGEWRHPMTDGAAVERVQRDIASLEPLDSAVLAEFKPLGAVIHYRNAPSLGPVLKAAAESIAGSTPGFECHSAKMAYELRPGDVGKDHVLRDWIAQHPFMGRVPVMIGDDLTDEPAMAWAQEAGGFAVKVGHGPTGARHRLDSPADVRAALAGWLAAHGAGP